MSLITDIKNDVAAVEAWSQKEFVVLETNFLPLAVTVTEYAKKAEDSGVPDAIALALSPDTNGMSVTFNNDAKIAITDALVIELKLESVTAATSPEQAGTVAASIDTAITGLAPKPKTQFFINLGVIILNVFKKLTGQTEAPTWMEDAQAIQATYEKMKADLAANATPTPLPQTAAEESKEAS